MAIKHLKDFLQEIQQDKKLLKSIKDSASANEIVLIASTYGYEFLGDELRSISNKDIPGMKIKRQDKSPSYSFGESGN